MNANPQETHFIKVSAASSLTVSGVVVAERVGVSCRITMYKIEKATENEKKNRFEMIKIQGK